MNLKLRFPLIYDYASAWMRNSRLLLGDVSFRKNVRVVSVVAVVAVMLFLAMWYLGLGIDARVHGQAPMNICEYLLSIIGAIDASPDVPKVNAAYVIFIRVLGAVLIGGVVTSFLCSLLDRFSDMTLRGLLVPPLCGHTVVVGFNSLTDDIVRKIADESSFDADLDAWYPHYSWPERLFRWWKPWTWQSPRILIYTNGDVMKVRRSLSSMLDPELAARLVYAYGDMDLSQETKRHEVCRRISVLNARKIFVLGDDPDGGNHDMENIAFASKLAEHFIRARKGAPRDRALSRSGHQVVPIYVQLDGSPSFDLVKKANYKLTSVGLLKKRYRIFRNYTRPIPYLKPFGFTEGWARRILSDDYETDRAARITPLDYRPMGPDDFVHLVLVGYSRMAVALAVEALRIAHYPQGRPTRITFVCESPHHRDHFRSLYRNLETISDVVVDFICGDLGGLPVVQADELLTREAKDPRCLLTVAVCHDDADEAMRCGLNLPEDVYVEGASVLIRQKHRTGLARSVLRQIRYRHVRFFGMQEDGVPVRFLKAFTTMYLNAAYSWRPLEDGRHFFRDCGIPSTDYPELKQAVEAFRRSCGDSCTFGRKYRERYDLLTRMLCTRSKTGDLKLLAAFKRYAFEEILRQKRYFMWASVYVVDSFGMILRTLGLEGRRTTGIPFPEICRNNSEVFAAARAVYSGGDALEEAEHRRWIADRVLMGYRATREGEDRNDDWRRHNCIRPRGEIDPVVAMNDAAAIQHIPLFLALEGVWLERKTNT